MTPPSFADRVQETTTTTGDTDPYDLGGAATGFQGFVAAGLDGEEVTVCVTNDTDWEIVQGTVTSGTPDQISRDTILASSNAGAAVAWGAGTKKIGCVLTAADIAAILATVAGTLPDPTSLPDGKVLTTASGAWVAADPSGGGGGGSGVLPDVAPASPSTYDDEFTGSALDSKWTTDTAPTGSATEEFQYLGTIMRLHVPGQASGNFWIFKQHLSGGEGAHSTKFMVTCKLSLSSRRLTDLEITNFEVGDNATYAAGGYLDVNLKNNASSPGDYAVSTYDGTEHNATDLGPLLGTAYLHLQRNTANELRCYVSLDGIAWREFYSATGQTFDFSYLFFRFYGSTTTGHNTVHGIDWVRINDARFDQGF